MIKLGILSAVGVICYLYGLWEGLREGKELTIKSLRPKVVLGTKSNGPTFKDASGNHKTKRMRK